MENKESQYNLLAVPLLDRNSPRTAISEYSESMSEKQSKPIWAYGAFLLAGAYGGMDGPFTQLMATEDPFLRVAWKFQGVLLYLVIFKIF